MDRTKTLRPKDMQKEKKLREENFNQAKL